MTTSIATLKAPQLDYILLDGSSSMISKWWPSLDAIDTLVATLQEANLNSQVIISTFDSVNINMIQRDCTLSAWTTCSHSPLTAHWGATPLYDAINTMGRALRDLDPPKCSIVIITDGEENSSKYTTLAQAKAILDWCRAKGYQVTFIGCDFNNARQAAALGANTSNSIGVDKKLLSDAAKNLGAKRAAYGLQGTPINFSPSEQQQFGGYLSAPSPN